MGLSDNNFDAPLSRVEALLQNALGADPQSRVEELLEKIDQELEAMDVGTEATTRSYSNAKSRVAEIEYNADFWSCKYVNVLAEMNVQPTYGGFDATHANFLGMEKSEN